MNKTFFLIISAILLSQNVFAVSAITPDDIIPKPHENSILQDTSGGIIGVLSLIQAVLLKVVLPLIIVGASLYVAYQLFTAEGDETKMKRAWKSIAYSSIALVAIALSAALVQIISQISL